MRSVGADCAVAIDGNAYSVPWRLIGERVRVTVGNEIVRVHHGGREVAVHAELKGAMAGSSTMPIWPGSWARASGRVTWRRRDRRPRRLRCCVRWRSMRRLSGEASDERP